MAVDEAARLMREQHLGCLVVTDDMKIGRVPVGMLTDRDIVTAIVAKGLEPRRPHAEDVMSAEPAVTHADDSVLDVRAAMRRKGVRRQPVVDAQGVLLDVLALDVLALDDVLEVVAEPLNAVVQAMSSGRPRELRARVD